VPPRDEFPTSFRSPQSTNVEGAMWVPNGKIFGWDGLPTLVIWFDEWPFIYSYGYISKEKWKSFYLSRSKGKWVWTYLRGRVPPYRNYPYRRLMWRNMNTVGVGGYAEHVNLPSGRNLEGVPEWKLIIEELRKHHNMDLDYHNWDADGWLKVEQVIMSQLANGQGNHMLMAGLKGPSQDKKVANWASNFGGLAATTRKANAFSASKALLGLVRLAIDRIRGK
jgi:hypothetical protein